VSPRKRFPIRESKEKATIKITISDVGGSTATATTIAKE
jgi:hypothetical protein